METKQQLEDYLQAIQQWEKDQSGLWFWEKIGRIPFKILDKLTPKFIQEKISVLVDELVSYVQTGGKYLVSEKTMMRHIQKHTLHSVSSIQDIGQMPIDDMVAISEKLQKNRANIATVQGASTGVGGIFTLAIDIPVILGIALKTLQEIALIHGYDPNEKTERIFIVKCLQFASSDIVGKEAILNELAQNYEQPRSSENMVSQLQGWQEVFYTYRDNFGMKKLFQMIPVAGMIFGAFINKSMIEDISEAGMMLYRKRRVMERMDQMVSSEL
ncbi:MULTISPECIES: EcsC family protein [Solibacillus]|uniref:EcsC family protein n=1 Tax=Solibacillus merdavium TaxID=2762218 RepID=A0ABR8XIW3_9BACL|nr:EcsC family protein [Solibacillus merdavium]MBD8031867.1 EcsC family protein [Solibacillus merdavium]